MDLTGPHVEVDAFIGEHAWEPLADSQHLESVDPGLAGREFVGVRHHAILGDLWDSEVFWTSESIELIRAV
jgi:hypothetical protein